MRLKFAIILLCSVLLSFSNTYCMELEEIKIDMDTVSGATIPEGIVVSAINMQELSTETCPEGYNVKFVSTNDLFIKDTKVIPENTEFYGYIEKIHEPIVGTNASMKVKITRMVLPDGYEMGVKGYLYSSNDNLIGGELTPPSEWVRMPHYQSRFQGISWNHRSATLQVRPGGKRSMGRHVKVPTGEQVLITFIAPLEITHIVEE